MIVQPHDKSAVNSSWKILIIDDDEDDYFIARSMLKEAKGRNFDVRWASTYEKGREELYANPYNAVLVDYDLGAHTGIELIREAKERGYPSPLILFTGRGTYEVDVEAMQAGATLYLTKNEANSLLLERAIRYAIERKQTEQALLERERKLSVVLDATELGTWTYNYNDHSFEMDERAQKLYRADGPRESLDAIVQNFLHPDDVPLMWAALRKAADPSGDGRYQVTYRIMQPDGSACWLNASGLAEFEGKGADRQAVRLIGASRDLTEQIHSAEALQNSEQRYRETLESITDGFLALDNNWCYTYFNETGARMIGMKREDLLGACVWELFPHAEHTRFYSGYHQAMETNHAVHFEEYYPEPINKWLECHCYPTKDGLTVYFRDITERKQAFDALHESEQRYSALFHAKTNGIAHCRVITDEQGRPIDYEIMQVNQAYEAITGIKRADIEGHRATEVFPGIEHFDFDYIGSYGKIALEGGELNFETFFEATQQWLAIYIYSPKPGEFTAIFTDVSQRRQIEDALRTSEAAMDAFFETSPGILNLFDQDLRYIKTDPFTPTYFDLNRQEVIGKSVWDLNRPFAEQFLGPMLERLTQTGQPELNLEVPGPIPSRNNEMGYWRVSYFPILFPQGKVGLGVIGIDITESKQAEQALLATELKSREILESISDGFFSFDREWRVTYINQRAGEQGGYRAEELMGNVIWDAVPQLLGSNLEAVYRKVMEERKAEMVEFRSPRSGRWFRLRVYPSTEGISVFSMDVTEDKLAEQALRESEERIRQLADAMPQLVWTARADGTVDYYNQRYQEYAGIAPADGENWEWGPVLHSADLQPTVDAWVKAVQTGQTYQIEHRVQMKDGTLRWHLSRGIPIKDEAGNVIRWFGTATDIDDLKRTEDKLRHSNQELEQFAFVASHDLQEPLRKIITFGDSLQRHLGDTPDRTAEEYLNRMRNASERMQVMINGLLDLSRVNRHGREFETVDLTQVVHEVVSDLETRIQSTGGQVIIEPLPVVEGDPLQLRQLFQNLILNAIKFHKPNTPPVVHVSGIIHPTKPAPTVEIKVADNGIGFEQQYAERIFQPFQRLHGKKEYEGTGLGLAICQRIIERHHGKIEVQSTPGQGSTFTVHLPAKAAV